MNEIFIRTARLIGAEGLRQLASSHVILFGLGGVGSHCAEALARGGIGHLTLIDHDVVSPSNINRQSIAYQSTIGQFKTDLMRERIRDINPEAKVTICRTFVLEDNLNEVIPADASYIIDAIDTMTAKIAIAMYAWEHQIPLLTAAGTGNKLDPFAFRIADLYETSVCPLCRVLRRELKKRGLPRLQVLFSTEKPIEPNETDCPDAVKENRPVPGSISYVPPVAGLLIAGTVVTNLLHPNPSLVPPFNPE